MGVEYQHFLIPRPNTFRPSAAQLAVLVETLAKENWIAAPDPDAARRMALIDELPLEDAGDIWAQIHLPFGYASVPRTLTAEWFQSQLSGDLRLGFPVCHADQTGLYYPLINDSGPPDDAYYEIELHVCHDYVHRKSESIDPAPTECRCGEPLEYYVDQDVFYASRIKVQCPRCRAVFDPSALEVVVRDSWTGEISVVNGGVIYRFAIVIDCRKCIPERRRTPIRANPSLVGLCQEVLGHRFYEVGEIY